MIRTYKSLIILLIFLLGSTAVSAKNEPNLKGLKNHFEIQGINVPDSIMDVVEHCTEIWSQYIYTDIPIQVSVSWQELKSNINAYAQPTTSFVIDSVYYPCALAEKLQKKNLNGENSDIEVVINKTINWNVHYDKNPEENQSDLTTTIIHELAHGLGFIGNITEEFLTTEEYPSPTPFDLLIADKNGNAIIQKTETSFSINNSVLTSDSLYWNGKYTKAFCGEKLRLYAPTTFNSGSTAYHLSETEYPTGCGYELMTPVLRSTEIIRNPDFAAIAMLADIGWNDFFISHSQPNNNSDLENETTISFSVNDTLRINANQTILYSFDNGKHIIAKTATFDEDDLFYATIPSLEFNHTISYAIQSVTENNDTIFLPVNYPNSFFNVFIGNDEESPIIEHNSISSIQTNNIDFNITATITDNFNIDSAYVIYSVRRNTTTIIEETTKNFTFNTLNTKCEINLSEENVQIIEGDEFLYNIVAIDKSGNTSYFFGKDNSNIVTFDIPLTPITYFETDFEADSIANYFELDKCSIKTENGFSNKAIHTVHPYVNSGADGKYNQYTATLKYPVVISSNPATLTFNEVVLVEPGKAGIEYGTFGFWDFVVVEASKDKNSTTWYELGKKGWDSQLKDIWETRFYSSIKNEGDNENSLAVGDSSLFRTHSINLLENKYFRTGDTIFIRFRLQADATNFGWGWAIDNLKIQEYKVLSTETIKEPKCTIYPNPCSDILYFKGENIKTINIYTQTGILVMSSNNTKQIDISNFNPGIYNITLLLETGQKAFHQIIKE